VWNPVSPRRYLPLNPTGQVLVVTDLAATTPVAVTTRWGDRACAALGDDPAYVRDVVRDLLANPQVRLVVFDGPVRGRAAYAAFWAGADVPTWRLDAEHLTLVRQFVDLYDDDVGIRKPLRPFWPVRIRYLEDQESP